MHGDLVDSLTYPKLPLKEAIVKPEFLIADFAKFDRPAQLHIGFIALSNFREVNHGALPKPRNEVYTSGMQSLVDPPG